MVGVGTTEVSRNRSATIILLCGLPGSGKSTLADFLCDESDYGYRNVVHIEYDAVARELENGRVNQAVFDEQSLEAWKTSRVAALGRLDNELKNHSSKNQDHILIIMDDNFHLRSMRRDIYRKCQDNCESTEIYFTIIWVDTPIEICRERNKKRTENRIPDSVIDKLYATMEPPSEKKAAWERSCLHLVGNDFRNGYVLQDVRKLLTTSPFRVIPPSPPVDSNILEEERKTTLESYTHSYDKLLRTWVGQVAKINRSKASHANLARKEILTKLRSLRDVIEPTSVMKWFVESLLRASKWEEEEMARLSGALQQSLAGRFEKNL